MIRLFESPSSFCEKLELFNITNADVSSAFQNFIFLEIILPLERLVFLNLNMILRTKFLVILNLG